VKEYAKQGVRVEPALLVSCLGYSSSLKMETCSSEMSVDFQQTTRRYILEDRTLHNYGCENLLSYLYKTLIISELILKGHRPESLILQRRSRNNFYGNRNPSKFEKKFLFYLCKEKITV
jgi:hypothetical protein